MKMWHYNMAIKTMELRLKTYRDDPLWNFYYDLHKYHFDMFLKLAH